MKDRASPEIGRRDFFRVLAAGAGAATAAGAASLTAAEMSGTDAKEQRARYQPSSPDIKSFYRVNRYPPKR